MRRRDFIALLGGATAWPVAAIAQQPEKIPKIGYLSPRSATLRERDESFRQGLRELGYVEGKNIIIEYRFAEGKFDRLPELAAELVNLKVDVVVSEVTQASLAAKGATTTIPIVIQSVSDPVGIGLVASLARPGGNVTGTSAMSSEVIGKALQLLKDVVPKLTSVAVLWNPDNAIFQAQMLKETQTAAGTLKLDLQIFAAGILMNWTRHSRRSTRRASARCWCCQTRYSFCIGHKSSILRERAACRRCTGRENLLRPAA
jgi:ABC-type uncharacterized transport system substrate-binding protein